MPKRTIAKVANLSDQEIKLIVKNMMIKFDQEEKQEVDLITILKHSIRGANFAITDRDQFEADFKERVGQIFA